MSKGPLRAIMFVEEFGEGGARNKVMLVCGHSIRSDGIYRARCHQCAKAGAGASARNREHTAMLQRLMHSPDYARHVATPASADTRPEGGDSTEIEAPFTSGAVPHEDEADAQTPIPSPRERK